MYVNNAIPSRIRKDLCASAGDVESIVVEIIINKEKIFLILLYKPPKTADSLLVSAISSILDKCSLESKCYYMIGDFNVNLSISPNALSDVFDSYDLKNIIKEPTCYKNVSNPTLLDPIVTNNIKRLIGCLNVCIGVSDFHNIVCAATRVKCPKFTPHVVKYRSYKRFDASKFTEELNGAPFHVGMLFDDINDSMWYHNKLLTDIVELHAPLKKKLVKKKQVPYMNGPLRKAINVKSMLRRKFHKYNTQSLWLKYKKQRNLVNKLKRDSMLKYFQERCSNANNISDFWRTISPFMSNKNNDSNGNISLYDDGKLISHQNNVANIFNDYFVNITENLSEPSHVLNMNTSDLLDHYANHSSVTHIKNYVNEQCVNEFSFTPVTNIQVKNKLKMLKSKKAPGYDGIPAKLLKLGADYISPHLCNLINVSLSQGIYPDAMKHAEIVPLFKKNDNLEKANYRPVSILISLSKVVEGLICDQLMTHFQNVLCSELSAYRKYHGCSNVLLQCVEQWKQILDNDETIGCIMMDLSKAFDSIPHGLTIAKLSAYGICEKSCDFIRSYLSDRKQRVKVGSCKSDWSYMKRGVPQGSLTGPVLFNIFLNDLVLLLRDNCHIYNYADDNSLAYFHKDPVVVKCKLEDVSHSALQWFKANCMEANPSKFQSIVLSRKKCDISFSIEGHVIKPTNYVKLLGVYLDDQLTFNQHIKEMTTKCARQVSAIGRLSKMLNVPCKMRILDAFVLSNFNYCNMIYHFCSVSDSKKIEKLLERALRYVYLDFDCSYKELLGRSNRSSLYVTRIRNILLTVFNIRHDLMPPMKQMYQHIA